MKILLIGEYSRLHNSLKEGLVKLGHDVTILAFSDGFKNYPVDFKLEKKWDTGALKKLKMGILRLSGFDMTSYLTYRRYIKNASQFKGFDVVQLINENSFYCNPYFETKILTRLFQDNDKVFLLSCGDDYQNVKFYFNHPELKSAIQPYLQTKNDADFPGVLKFRAEGFKKLHEFIYRNISGVIATDIDYYVPLAENPKCLGMIPTPVNVDKIAFHPMPIGEKVNIFLGINEESYQKKGLCYFEAALKLIATRYGDRVGIMVSRNRPYEEYITLYDNAHILLDVVYAHDQGYNALEAMAKGKVVFTGAEEEFSKYYNISKPVAINSVPDAEKIAEALSQLIENPGQIAEIGSRAREFVERTHHYVSIAEEYLKKWNG